MGKGLQEWRVCSSRRGSDIAGGRRGLAEPCLVNDAPRSSPAITAEELLSDTKNMGRGGPKANTVSKKRGPGAS